MAMNALEKWYNRNFAKVVSVGDRYGVKRRILFTVQFLDIDSLVPENPFRGSMYGHPSLEKQPTKVVWWDRPAAIDKFALTDDLPKVITAYERLGCYNKPPEPVLPKPEVIDNISMALAEHKLRGKS